MDEERKRIKTFGGRGIRFSGFFLERGWQAFRLQGEEERFRRRGIDERGRSIGREFHG